MESLLVLVLSLLVGLVLSYKFLFHGKNDYKKSPIIGVIVIFAGMGLGLSLFGVYYLGENAWGTEEKDKWEITKREISEDGNISVEEKFQPFDKETLAFDNSIISTSTIIFTIAGIFLSALGIFWLGYLEESRLEKDRNHDQRVQRDRVLSLLKLGIDLFFRINKKELKFMIEETKLEQPISLAEMGVNYEGIKYYNLAKLKDIENYKLEYDKHIVSLCEYLYNSRNLQKNTILDDIHTIIEELKIIFYEKDIVLFNTNDKQKREKFIELLKQYNDYKNFTEKKTEENRLTEEAYEGYEVKLEKLINKDEEKDLTPLGYLRTQYEKKGNFTFFEYFVEKISKEFSEKFLVHHQRIFATFFVPNIREVFESMKVSHMEPHKFFAAYFTVAMYASLDEKKRIGEIDLRKEDLSFETYLEIMQVAFLQIDADIKAVKELYSLFAAFVKLYEVFEEKEE